MDVNNKTILLTGASSGIGAALALQLAPVAGKLILIARREPELEKIKSRINIINPAVKVYIFPLDISIAENQKEIADRLHALDLSVDVLINNAGIGDENAFHQSDIKKVNDIIDLNIKSVVNLTHLLLPSMMDNPKGKAIIFVGSGGGIAWMAGSSVYSASKHFITAFAMNLKSELTPYGIYVSLVAPGPVDTEFDKIAGIKGGMKGGPSQNTRISAEECAADIMLQLQKNKTLILPGKKLRRLMNFYLMLPWFIRVKLLTNDGQKLYKQMNLQK